MPSVMHAISGTACVHRFGDGVGRERRRHENQRHVGLRLLHRLPDRVEHRHHVVKHLPAPSWRHAGHHLRAVRFARPGMETPLPTGDALHEDTGLFVQQYAHPSLTQCAGTG